MVFALNQVSRKYDVHRTFLYLVSDRGQLEPVRPSLIGACTTVAGQVMDRLNTFVAGSYNLATRIVTVEGLRQLAQVGAASEHSALLFVNIAAGFSQINLRSESTTSLQCTGYRGPVTELQDWVMVCELFNGVIANV